MTKAPRRKIKKGVVLIYVAVAMVVFIAFVSLSVDLARAQKVKTELQIAVDAAARNGAANLFTTVTQAQNAAINTAAANKVDGVSVALTASQIEFGTWNSSTKTFTVLAGTARSAANAMRVTISRTASTNTGVPLMFGAIVGKRTVDMTVRSIAMQVPAINVNQNVLATGNPFLAGMPAGSIGSRVNPANDPDVAGSGTNQQNSPDLVAMTVTPGSSLSFDSISGTANHDPNLLYADPDGDLSEQIGHNNLTTNYYNNYGSTMYNENGIADAWIPINAIVGIFLDDTQPNLTSAPENLDFRTSASRDFTTLQPKLKQMFFIGDGLNSNGQRQQFVPPSGATRLYLGMMDYYQWGNNGGYRNIRITAPKFITTVQ